MSILRVANQMIYVESKHPSFTIETYETALGSHYAYGPPRWHPLAILASEPLTTLGLIVPSYPAPLDYKREAHLSIDGTGWELTGCWLAETVDQADGRCKSVLIFDRACRQDSLKRVANGPGQLSPRFYCVSCGGIGEENSDCAKCGLPM